LEKSVEAKKKKDGRKRDGEVETDITKKGPDLYPSLRKGREGSRNRVSNTKEKKKLPFPPGRRTGS